MANGVIIPNTNYDSGTTNVSGITWTRKGNSVTVGVSAVTGTADATVTITGLPTPKDGIYVLSPLIAANSIAGFIQFNNNVWIVHYYSTAVVYGSVTFTVE